MSTTPSQNTLRQNGTGTGRSSFKKMSLSSRVAIHFSVGLMAALAILFLPAGTFRWWQGRIYLGILFVPTLSAYLYFLRHNPQFLESRLQQKEQVGEQKLLIRLSAPLFIGASLVPGFDYRLGWSRNLLGEMPLALTVIGEAMALASMLFAMWSMNVNRFAARTIKVEAGQTVISIGPYRFVRHPLYAGAAILWVFSPLALGSSVTLPAFVLLVFFYVIRLLNEEKVLRKELPGYIEYCKKTRFRLIPFVW